MNRLFKKTFGWLLCLALAITMLPVAGRTARGAEEEETQEEAVFSLSDGYITVMDDVVYVNNKEAGTVTEKTIVIEGDSKTATTNSISISAGEGKAVTVVIRNVNIDVSENDFHAISIVGDGNVTIRFEGKNTVKGGKNRAGIQKENKGQLIITAMSDANELVAIGGEGGAGIGGGSYRSGTNITISGGTVTANGGEEGAGIGGGNSGSGTNITISGGTVIANGGLYGAGIGGGDSCDGTNITISGGTVTATGGVYGAGIGGGRQGHGSNIIINREAEVTANGVDSGAGIGGGFQGDGTNITISGGTVTAIGGLHGAGIGGGDRGSGIEIKITEKANVTATGGKRGAGIGGGFNCPGKTIKIIGDANVTASGIGGGAGIGGGNGGDGTEITITDNANVIACGEEGGAGIGGGCDGENSVNIKIQKNAVVCVAGGQDGDFYGEGAGIGNGGAADDSFGGIGLPEIEDGDELSLADIIEAPFTGDVRYYLWGTTAKEIANGTAKRRDYCTITLNANDGQGTEKTLEVTEELPSALPANPFVKPGHTIIKWTTEQDGTGESYDDKATIEATGDFTLYVQWSDHVYTETVDENYLVSAADCTEASVYYKSCKCGEKSTETFTSGEPLGHDYKTVDGSAATPSCEKAGKEADQKCERCGDVITGKEIPATGHTFDKEAVDAKYLKSAADCTHAAVYYKSCACGEKGTETFESGEPLDHDYKTVEGSAVAPTCEKAGKEADQKCERCSDVITGKEIPATGHTWKAATGYAPKTCMVCGTTEGDVIKYNSEAGKTIEHTKDDAKDETVTYHRSEDDKNAIDHYKGVQIDGKDVKVDAKSGSVILTFDAATLNALGVGDHVIKVIFDDWVDELKLVIKAPMSAAVDPAPTTGDSSLPVLWVTLLLLSMAGASAVVMRRRKQA